MYRSKRNAALSTALEAEFEKEGKKALLFSVVAAVFSIIDNADRKISIAGISIDLKEQYLLNGAFCGLAVVFGVSALLVALNLYGAGWPRHYAGFYKRFLSRKRNRDGVKYNPRTAKLQVRFLCFIFGLPVSAVALLVLPVYVYGVAVTAPDLFRIAQIVYSKILWFV